MYVATIQKFYCDADIVKCLMVSFAYILEMYALFLPFG